MGSGRGTPSSPVYRSNPNWDPRSNPGGSGIFGHPSHRCRLVVDPLSKLEIPCRALSKFVECWDIWESLSNFWPTMALAGIGHPFNTQSSLLSSQTSNRSASLIENSDILALAAFLNKNHPNSVQLFCVGLLGPNPPSYSDLPNYVDTLARLNVE